jgi:integrase
MARPRIDIGTYGTITTRRTGEQTIAETRVRDADGRVRQVRVSRETAPQARRELKKRLLRRPGFGHAGDLRPDAPFTTLVNRWDADLETKELADGTKDHYRDQVRLYILPAFEHFTLAELTTGRVEALLNAQEVDSPSRARKTRTVLNLLFGYALRHDAINRNPVQGTSRLRAVKNKPKALTLEQVSKIREAAANWRTDPGLPGPKPDGQVRDIIEILLGTAMRPGEVLALRPCDITDGPTGMIAAVTGTVVQRKKKGTFRQERPKTDASNRVVPVPEFAAAVIRRRMRDVPAERTIFAARNGGPLVPPNVRRTFREFLVDAGLADSGISLRWYRRTGATVIARGMDSDAAAAFLGHTSTSITEGFYIEVDPTVDRAPAAHMERTFRRENPDGSLLALPPAPGEAEVIARVEQEGDDGDAVA